jgi:hypothetical protein
MRHILAKRSTTNITAPAIHPIWVIALLVMAIVASYVRTAEKKLGRELNAATTAQQLVR